MKISNVTAGILQIVEGLSRDGQIKFSRQKNETVCGDRCRARSNRPNNHYCCCLEVIFVEKTI